MIGIPNEQFLLLMAHTLARTITSEVVLRLSDGLITLLFWGGMLPAKLSREVGGVCVSRPPALVRTHVHIRTHVHMARTHTRTHTHKQI